MNVSWWRQYALLHMDPELIRVIIALVKEHFDLTGSFPSVAQILALLKADH